MSEQKGRIVRINDFGLCEVASVDGRRFGFTLDKLPGYAGQPLRDVGLRVGAEVVFQSDESGRVAEVVRAGTAGS